jgi:hypothetical protein
VGGEEAIAGPLGEVKKGKRKDHDTIRFAFLLFTFYFLLFKEQDRGPKQRDNDHGEAGPAHDGTALLASQPLSRGA